MTRLLVLGMLDIHPMSGYDVQQMLRLNDAERWGGVLIGSIYHALKKLEKEGHIKITSIEQTGHRQKAVYQITAQGQAHLRELIRDSIGTSSIPYPSSLYSGLSFFHKVSAEETRQALELQLENLEREIKAMEYGLESKNAAMQNNIPPMTQLIFDHMFAVIQQQQDFVKKALLLLEGN